MLSSRQRCNEFMALNKLATFKVTEMWADYNEGQVTERKQAKRVEQDSSAA